MTEGARERGLRLFEDIYGPEMARGVEGNITSGGFGARQSEWTVDFNFGEVWSSDGLERRKRSIAVLGMLIAQRASDEIRYHTRMGLRNGLTVREIEEILYTAVPYCGFPAAQTAKKAMLLGFADEGVEI